ncbi:MAG: DUF4846 domain-containing protein [Desulfobacterales bacterium]|nr:DUF4846 domain-containing protein [Desulfobacterales bacterium]
MTPPASLALARPYSWLPPNGQEPARTIGERISPPEGFHRVQVEEGGFAHWLRGLPLKPDGAPVHLYGGSLKSRQDVHEAVVDMDVLKFQQCADAVMRLRAEYLWSAGKADKICFNFTSGDACCWKKWRNGWRPRLINKGRKVVFERTRGKDASRQAFMSYLDKVMEYAGTASLSRELPRATPERLRTGDVIIQGGFPGHAVLVLDMVENQHGERAMLLGQSYMPSQEFHVLKNPAGGESSLFSIFTGGKSPWFSIPTAGTLETPEWIFKITKACRRFPK